MSRKFIAIGFAAGFFLLFFYFIFLSLANSFSHALEQFVGMWYWILLLVIGFGIQVGLYFYIRASFKSRQISTATVVTSGGISTGSMVACCLHHLVDVLPFLGLAAAATFLATYQIFFIIIGILSNIVGITIMLEMIQRHNLSEGFLKKYNMRKIKKATIGLSLALSAAAFVLAGGFLEKRDNNFQLGSEIESEPKESISIKDLKTKTDSRNGISFEISPVYSDNSLKFEVKIDTHSGSLDFDLAEISVLEDNKGNKYQPMDWQGSASGGHHRSGILIFPRLDISTETIKLIIKDSPGSSPRIFEWDLENE